MTDQPGQKKKKRRRPRGSGSVYRPGGGPIWWISYFGPDGKRQKESSGSTRKADAELLLQSRNGSRIHHLPVVRNAEKLTFNEAAHAAIDYYEINHPSSLKGVRLRIAKHLTPFFGGQRMAGITTGDVANYVAWRCKQGIVAVEGPRKGERVKDVSNAEINREIQLLKRIFNLAMEQNRIATKPKIKMLIESPARSGFFEREQFDSVLRYLPASIRPVVSFGYHTGWRIASEVLPLEWRNVDFAAGEVRIDAGASKNRAPRVFPMSVALRTLLEGQKAEHDGLKQSGVICPHVFFRMVAKGRGGPQLPIRITTFRKAWEAAVVKACCPGKILHDLRRTAVRNLVRAGIPQQVAMAMTGHRTTSVFERYNIVSGGDLKDAAVKMNAAAGS